MEYSTTNVYIMKRSIIEFGKRIFGDAERSEQKFATDMTYGMLVSGSCLLTKIVDALHEKAKKVNAVERLGKHLKERVAESIQKKYLQLMYIPA